MGKWGKAKMHQDDLLSITREKFNQAVKEAKPLFCYFSVTEACNLNCKYCGSDSKKPLDNELTTEEVYDVLDNIAEACTMAVLLAGGEPTSRKDLLQIARYGAAHRLRMAVNTHGHFIDKEYAWKLRDAGVLEVKVSIDGLEETHDANRGEGSFKRAIEALKNCKMVGIPFVEMAATISRVNYHELKDIVNLALELEVGIIANEFSPIGRPTGMFDLILTREQRREMQRYLLKTRKALGWRKVNFEDIYVVSEDEETKGICADQCRSCGYHDFNVGCISGIYAYSITAEGKVIGGDIIFPGDVARYPGLVIGDLRKERMSDIWRNSEVLDLFRNRDNLKGKCGSCKYKYICGGCRRRAYLTGDVMGEDPSCWVEDTG